MFFDFRYIIIKLKEVYTNEDDKIWYREVVNNFASVYTIIKWFVLHIILWGENKIYSSKCHAILNLISCSQTLRQTQFLIPAYYGSKHCRVRLLTAWWASSARNWTAWARTVRRSDNCWIAVFRARLPRSCARTPSPKTIQIGKNIINYNIIYYNMISMPVKLSYLDNVVY